VLDGPGRLPVKESRLRVAFYCDSCQVGGAETSLRSLLVSLSPRIDATVVGVEPDVVAWLAAGRRGSKALILPPIRRKRDVGAILAHLTAIRRLRPQIFHVSLSSPWGSHWALLASIFTPGVRTVAVEQSPWETTRLRQRALKRFTSRRLAAHVAVGEASAEAVARFSGAPRKRIRTIHNGVPEIDVSPLMRPVTTPIVGAIGRLEHEKGFDILLRALVDLPGLTAILVGEGRQKQELIGLAEQLGVTDRVLFAGWSEEPRRHLPTFDLYVLPSRFEGFPLVVIEAMLASLPVVATNVGSVADAVLQDATGLLVPPEDPEAIAAAVHALLADPERMREMGRRGKEHARRHFTASAMAASFEELYEELVA
jgi:glycosyltransferase involved in cell wall biosynthesis